MFKFNYYSLYNNNKQILINRDISINLEKCNSNTTYKETNIRHKISKLSNNRIIIIEKQLFWHIYLIFPVPLVFQITIPLTRNNTVQTRLHSNRRVTFLVLLDLSAVFDTVQISLLLKILHYYFNISGTALNWINYYLSNRTQQ